MSKFRFKFQLHPPPQGTFGITHISTENFPNISSNSGLVQINDKGNVFVQIFNNDVLAVEIPMNAVLGQLEVISKERFKIVDKNLFLASIDKVVGHSKIHSPPPPPQLSLKGTMCLSM
jgi:hypothetical protein